MSKELLDSDYIKTLELLNDKKININFKDNLGRNSLFYADRNKSIMLLTAGIDFNATDNKGYSALDYAIRKADLDINKLDYDKILLLFRIGMLAYYQPKNPELTNLIINIYNESLLENTYQESLRNIMIKNLENLKQKNLTK